MASLRERSWRLSTTWPSPVRAEVKRYVRWRAIPCLRTGRTPPPHFILLPVWLLHRYRPTPSRCDRAFLEDVLWAQFCLYLSFRIKDDLLDHDADGGLLVFAADLLQLESSRTLSRHFPARSRFWALYFRFLEITVRAIIQVDALQRSSGGSADTLLKEYANVCAIFKVGAAAVCIRCSARRDVQYASRFWNEMAIAGQLLDDLEDLEQDRARHRFNSIVRLISVTGKRGFAGRILSPRAIRRELMLGGFDRILRMVLRRIDRAEEALAPLHSVAPYPGFQDYRRAVEGARRRAHRDTVRLFFSGV